jgi:prolyl-tRNA synthetase
MLWSKTFIPTLKEAPTDAESISHQLLLRAGLVRPLMAGVYSYLPLGLRVLDNIKNIVRQEMEAAGAVEVLLPALQPLDLWARSGRDKDIAEVMIKFRDRRGRNVCLGPTHEEVITELIANHVSSYKQLPLVLYQIQTKFRDELRPRFGLVRACEFIMKDAYSFDQDEAGLDKNYRAMHKAYTNIFKRCGLNFLSLEADPGVMGGAVSHEFMVPAKDGEDAVLSCPGCGKIFPLKENQTGACKECGKKIEKLNCIEVGHIFKLGTKYSLALKASFLDAQQQARPIIMGCYGIGVSRLVSAILEQNYDSEGIIWPKEISPYDATILVLDTTDKKIMEFACGVYEELRKTGLKILLDDRDERAGVKFKDADLVGIPLHIIIGQKTIKQKKIELKLRGNKETSLVQFKDLGEEVKKAIKNIK